MMLTLQDQARWLAQRKAEIGDVRIPANDGSRRTPEKRALLRALRDHARAEGREPRFHAMIGDEQEGRR